MTRLGVADIENASIAHHSAIDLALAAHGRTVDEAIRQGVSNFESSIVSNSEQAIAKIGDEVRSLAEQLAEKLSAIETTVVGRGGALEERLALRNTDFAMAIAAGLEATDEKASQRLRDIGASLEGLAKRIDDGLAARGKALTEVLARQTLDVAKTLSEGGRELAEGISTKSAEVAVTLQTRADASQRRLPISRAASPRRWSASSTR